MPLWVKKNEDEFASIYSENLEELPYIKCVVCKFGVRVGKSRYLDYVEIVKLVKNKSKEEILREMESASKNIKKGSRILRKKITEFSVHVFAYLIYDEDIEEGTYSKLEELLKKVKYQFDYDELVKKFEELEILAAKYPTEKVMLANLFMSESCVAFEDEFGPKKKLEDLLNDESVLRQIMLLSLAVQVVKYASMDASDQVDVDAIYKATPCFSSFMNFYYMPVEDKATAMDEAIESYYVNCAFSIIKFNDLMIVDEYDWAKRGNLTLPILAKNFLSLRISEQLKTQTERMIEDTKAVYERLTEILPGIIQGIYFAGSVEDKLSIYGVLDTYSALSTEIEEDLKNEDLDAASLRLIKKTYLLTYAFLTSDSKGTLETFLWQILALCLDRTIYTGGKEVILKRDDIDLTPVSVPQVESSFSEEQPNY